MVKGAVLTDTEMKSFQLAAKYIQYRNFRLFHSSPERDCRLNSPTHSVLICSELDFHTDLVTSFLVLIMRLTGPLGTWLKL